jgi:hypothetical protein
MMMAALEVASMVGGNQPVGDDRRGERDKQGTLERKQNTGARLDRCGWLVVVFGAVAVVLCDCYGFCVGRGRKQ